MPEHPNVVRPPDALVVAKEMNNGNQNELLCGALFPIIGDSNLDDEVEKSKTVDSHLILSEEAKWLFQMSSAIAHTHLAAHTFHMDIKPSNFVGSKENRDLILIDWEQSGAPLCTLAPEADGTWDVEERKPLNDGLLVYKKYTGPKRENLPWSQPNWNIFPIWNE